MTFEQLSKKMTSQGLKIESYSGRFMYVAKCVSVVMSNPGEYDLPRGWKQDNMGLDYVVYWPEVTWKAAS